MTARIPCDPAAPSAAAIAAAVRAVDEGSSILVLGDAGYAPFRRWNDDRVSQDGGFPVFMSATLDALETFVNRPPPRAGRIAEAFWPGPLTLQFGPPNRPVRVRVSAAPAVRVVSAAISGLPVLIETPGGRPVADAEAAAKSWPDASLVLDSGSFSSTSPATILGVEPDGALQIVFDGAPRVLDVRKRVPLEILCVCTGNTCRSPMAAALLRRALAEATGVDVSNLTERGFSVGSAGVSAFPGSPASDGASAAMRAAGLTLEHHRSSKADLGRLASADVIFAMTADHLRRIDEIQGSRTTTRGVLLDPGGSDIDDPFGGDDRVYRRTAERLASIVRQRAAELARRP